MSDQENNKSNDPDLLPDNELKSNIPPGIAIFAGVVGIFILYQIIGGLLMILIFGMDLQKVDTNAYRLFQIASQFLFIFIPSIFLAKMFFNDVTKVMRIKSVSLPEVGLFSVGILLVTVLAVDFQALQDILFRKVIDILPFLSGLKEFFDNFNEMIDEAYSRILTSNTIPEFILVTFTVAVTPAICEEFLFRGFVLKGFEFIVKPFWAAAFTATIFSLYHVNFYGFFPLIGIGLYLGYAAYKSNSMIVPVILHFINNFIAILLFNLFNEEEFVQSTGAFQEPWIHLLRFTILLIIFISLVFVINRYYREKKEQLQEKI
jgi:hypothetical protein